MLIAVCVGVIIWIIGAALVHFKSFSKQVLYLFLLALLVIGACAFGDVKVLYMITLCASIVVVLFFGLLELSRKLIYKNYKHVPQFHRPFFCNEKVLIIIPHQDDEINLAGGVIEQYVAAGSEVFIAYYTNGDYLGRQQYRLKEAIKVADMYGVDEKHVVFMGFGDQWASEYKHIYNEEPSKDIKSKANRFCTYGMKEHKAYIDGLIYSRDNVVKAFCRLIEDIEPSTIYCTDYDIHADHRALSLFFEEAMGLILKKRNDYHPKVYKGFAYSTAFLGADDFYAENLLATQNKDGHEYMTENGIYKWEERFRIPVSFPAAIPFLMGNSVFSGWEAYVSQRNYLDNARYIINSDKVFWHRRTDSVFYNASVTVSSGDARRLTDFKLVDTVDVNSLELPFSSTWHPEEDDKEKRIHIALSKAVKIKYLSLIENPSLSDNVLEFCVVINNNQKKICVERDNGQNPEFKVCLNGEMVTDIDIFITKYEGDDYGFVEIEAFEEEIEDAIAKITDADGNFVYFFTTPISGKCNLSLYNCDGNSYEVISDNPRCEVSKTNGEISLYCPKGEKTVIKLVEKLGEESIIIDEVVVENLSGFERSARNLLRFIDHIYINKSFGAQIKYYEAFYVRIASTIKKKIGNQIS